VNRRATPSADALVAFALPDANETRVTSNTEVLPNAARPNGALRTRLSEAELKAPGPVLLEGQGKDVVTRMCTRCHGTAVFSGMRMSRAAWESEVAAMVEKGAVGTAREIRTAVTYLVTHFGPR
jgi:cytochrome c5